MSRVEALATREVETKSRKDDMGVRWIVDKEEARPPYVMMVPLIEIIAEALGSGVASQKVVRMYESLLFSLGTEFKILLETTLPDIERVTGVRVAEAVGKVRAGDIAIEPGYDGVFGKVKIWREENVETSEENDQETLF